MEKYTKDSVTQIIRDLFAYADVQDVQTLAAMMGVNKRTIDNWYTGYTEPKAHELFNLFDVLNVPVEAFLKARDKASHDRDLRTKINWWHNNIATGEDMECIDMIIDSTHGSSVSSVLKMMAAYLCLPLAERMRICHNITETYRFHMDYGDLLNTIKEKYISDILSSMALARKAALEDKDYYNDLRG